MTTGVGDHRAEIVSVRSGATGLGLGVLCAVVLIVFVQQVQQSEDHTLRNEIAEQATREAVQVSKEAPEHAHEVTKPLVQVAQQHVEAMSSRERDVREAALRYMFRKNASGQQQQAHVYCIGFVDDTDPPAEFIARLGDVRPIVKPLSACDASAEDGVTDKASGQHGLEFRIDQVRWIDADHAEIEGGYYEGSLSASGNTYYLQRKHRAWVVVKDVMHWISELGHRDRRGEFMAINVNAADAASASCSFACASHARNTTRPS
jgi:hypothetical protein